MFFSNFANVRRESGSPKEKEIKATSHLTRNSYQERMQEPRQIHDPASKGNNTMSNKVSVPQGSRKRLSEEEYAEVKRRKKENDMLRKEWPRIITNEAGKRSSLSIDGDRVPLYMGDVQSLLFFSVLGNKSPSLPRWGNFINVTKASHVVMVHVEGVGLDDMQRNAHTPSQLSRNAEDGRKDCQQEGNSGKTYKNVSSSGGLPEWLKSTLPRTSDNMSHALEVVAPCTHDACPVEELLLMKAEKTTKRVIEEDIKNISEKDVKSAKPYRSFFKFLSTISPNPDDKLHPNDKFSRLNLLLRPGDLVKNSFPLPLPGYRKNRNKEFVLTSDNYKEVTSSSPMFGLDCEMCLTTIQKLELTSISLVNEKLELVYHTLVLPYNTVVNFLTNYSGITRQMLHNVTKRLEDVQQDLQKLLPPDAILVGHSLDSDLNALKMMHPYIIDSSLAYNISGNCKKRSSLKALCKIFLDEDIQTAGQGGHDPTEDAIATLKLIQFKLEKDEVYGNVLQGWVPPGPVFSDWQMCQPDIPNHQQQEASKNSTQDTKKEEQQEQVEQNSKTAVEAIGPFNRKDIYIFQKLELCSVAIITTSQCLKNYLPMLASLTRMPTVEVLTGNKQVSKRAKDFVPEYKLIYVHLEMSKKLSQCPDEATRQRQLTKLDKRLQRIQEAAVPKTIFICVFSGSSMKVPYKERSNGFVLIGIKDLPFKT